MNTQNRSARNAYPAGMQTVRSMCRRVGDSSSLDASRARSDARIAPAERAAGGPLTKASGLI